MCRAGSPDKAGPLPDWPAPFLRDGGMDGRQGNAEIVLSRTRGRDEHTGGANGRRAAAAQRRRGSSRHRGDVGDPARGVSLRTAAPPRIREPRPRHRLRPDQAPYDIILVAAASPEVPPALIEQLAPGGRLVIPLGRASDEHQDLRVYERRGDAVTSRSLFPVRFVP